MTHIPESVEIYVRLLGDEEGTLRPTQGIPMGRDVYTILPIQNYETADEEWEFLPGTLVKCEPRKYREQNYLLAVEQIG